MRTHSIFNLSFLALSLAACGSPLEHEELEAATGAQEIVSEQEGDELSDFAPNDAEALADEGELPFAGSMDELDAVGAQQSRIGVKVGSCRPRSDWAHVTSNQASAHAWWDRFGGNCTVQRATVHIMLQAFKNGRWINKTDVRERTIAPGGNRRANARADCNGSWKTRWRQVYEIDYLGVIDPVVWHIGEEREIRCGA